jgi:hypothetical protein
MEKFLFVCVLSIIGLVACSTSQELTYRPLNSSELWNIRIEFGTYSEQFEVFVNDTIIFEESPNMFTSTIDEKTTYKNHLFRLLVNYSSGFLGIGEGYEALLFCDNELITKQNF